MNYLNMPLFDAKKNLASYAESLITVIAELKKETPYRFYAYNIKEEGKKYSNAGISVLPANLQEETVDKEAKLKKLTYTYTKEGVEVKGDIPAIIWEEDFDGSRSMNAKAKNKYLYDVLMANLSTPPTQSVPQPKAETNSISALPKDSPKEVFEPATNVKEEVLDDLPF